MKLGVLDLFAGIGGFSLGLERTGGFETVAFCEIEKYPQKVLAKHWPGVPIYDDVRELTAERLARDGIGVDVITGGFPCQDISAAGKQAGIADGTRSGLWSECARLLGSIQPRYAIFENVTALLSGNGGQWFEQVLWDISQVGYDAEWHCIPASAIGARHRRDRVWIIAYPKSGRWAERGQREELKRPESGGNGEARYVENACSRRLRGQGKGEIQQQRRAETVSSGKAVADTNSNAHSKRPLSAEWGGRGEVYDSLRNGLRNRGAGYDVWATESRLGRVAHGVPRTMDRLKCLGNAVVPQIPELIGRAILEHEYAAKT